MPKYKYFNNQPKEKKAINIKIKEGCPIYQQFFSNVIFHFNLKDEVIQNFIKLV